MAVLSSTRGGFRTLALAILVFVGISADARAQVPTFTKAFADVGAGQLLIWGRNFVTSPEPRVFIGTETAGFEALPLVSASESLIVAGIDPQITAGTYSLMVNFTFAAGSKSLPFSVTVGTAGPQGPPGPPGAPGATPTLDALNGTTCHVGTDTGTVAVTVAADGAVVIRCVLPPPPPPPDEDPGDWEFSLIDPHVLPSVAQFLARARTVPTAAGEYGSGLYLVTWEPPSGTAIMIGLTPAIFNLEELAPDSVGTYAAPFTVTFNVAAPLRIEARNFGALVGVCSFTYAPQLTMSGAIEFSGSTPGSPLDRVSVQTVAIGAPTVPLSSYCGSFVDESIDEPIFEDVQDQLVGAIVADFTQPFCRVEGSETEFALCSAP